MSVLLSNARACHVIKGNLLTFFSTSTYIIFKTFSMSIIMATLHSRGGHYIFALWLLLSFFLFPRLISVVTHWMYVYHTSTHGVALVRI